MREIYGIVVILLFAFGWAAFTIVDMEKQLDRKDVGTETWRCVEYNNADKKCVTLRRNRGV